MPAPRILFLADSGAEVGGGHVMRSLTLAKAVEAAGGEAVFAATPAAKAVLDAFGAPKGGVIPIEGGHPDALSVQGAAAVKQAAATAVVVDHYGMAEAQEAPLRAAARVVAIDDLADRKHACDLLVDPGLGHDEAAYAELAPGAKVLSGPAFALVRPEFAALREESLARRAKNEPVRRVLVSLGLTDFGAITQKVMEGILPDASEVAFDVVLGVGCESLDYVKGLEGKGVTLHVNTPDMARLMAGADIAIGAGGSSVWERATLGLPSILVVLADNQHRTAMELSSRGATEVIDRRALAFEAMMSGVWYAVLANADERAKLSRNSSALCDGLGAGRVAAEIMALVSA